MIFFSILIVFIPFIDICNSSVKYSIQLRTITRSRNKLKNKKSYITIDILYNTAKSETVARHRTGCGGLRTCHSIITMPLYLKRNINFLELQYYRCNVSKQ